MEATILRSEALKEADTGEPFDMVFVTCDRRRGTGGELVIVKTWQKMGTEPTTRSTTLPKAVSGISKSPNHWENKTINIHNANNKATHPMKVHFRLIQFFNGKRVING